MTEQPTFEEALAELENCVTRLEAGDLPLEETMAIFERGQALVAICEDTLNKAELRLESLRESADGGQALNHPKDVEE